MTASQVFLIIVFPQAYRKMLPAIISQFVTVIKDTSLLYSVIAIQELFGKSQILMGKYFQAKEVFALYALITLIYFLINVSISMFSRRLAKNGHKPTKTTSLVEQQGRFSLFHKRETLCQSNAPF